MYDYIHIKIDFFYKIPSLFKMCPRDCNLTQEYVETQQDETQVENIQDVEIFTINDVNRKIALVQDIKLLHLQTAFFFNKEDTDEEEYKEDVLIEIIVCKKSLLKTIEKYRTQFSSIQVHEWRDHEIGKNYCVIFIKKLSSLSYLRMGLEKETLSLIEDYF